MRLLFATTESGWRGGEVQLTLLAAELSRRGHALRVAAPPGAALWERLPAAIERATVRAQNDLDLRAALSLRRLARDRDLVHAFTARAHALGRLSGRPLLVSRLVGFRAGKGPLGRLKYGGAAHFAAVSRQAAGELQRAGVAPERISFVPSAVEERFFEPAPGGVRASLGLPEGAFVVGTVAALSPEKDLCSLVRAFARAKLAGARLLVVGEGPERAAITVEAERSGVALSLPGRAGSPEGVRAALSAMDLFALSSRAEGLPTALLEAMAAGVPVVATAVGGVPDAVADGETGLLVPPGDETALAGAIARLGADAPLRARLAAGARRAADAYRVATVADAAERLYERLATR